MSPGPRRAVGLADASYFIAREHERTLEGVPPDRLAVSVVTIAELQLGVLAADSGPSRAQRLATLQVADALERFPVTREVASRWASLRLALRDADRRVPLNDSWIAATALAHGMPVVTQDDDHDEVPGLEVIKV